MSEELSLQCATGRYNRFTFTMSSVAGTAAPTFSPFGDVERSAETQVEVPLGPFGGSTRVWPTANCFRFGIQLEEDFVSQ